MRSVIGSQGDSSPTLYRGVVPLLQVVREKRRFICMGDVRRDRKGALIKPEIGMLLCEVWQRDRLHRNMVWCDVMCDVM